MSFADLHRKFWGSARPSPRQRRRRGERRGRVLLEVLEARVVLSTWSGAASDLWSNAGNWDVPPTTGSDLVFPAVANETSTNDLSGMTFGSLTVSAGGYTISGDAVTLNGAIDSSQSTGSNTVSLPITFSGAGSVTVDNSGAALDLGGVLSGSSGLTKQGAGLLDLTATNAYSGTTTVSDGMLQVDGAQGQSPVTIDAGATLAGVGTVGTITSNTGNVAPGDSAPGLLTDTGDLDLGVGTNFNVALNNDTAGTGYSQLQVGGTINLNDATLNITPGTGYAPEPGDQITLIQNNGSAPVSGTFIGLAQGADLTIAGQQFQISYTGGTNGNSVVLTALIGSSVAVTAVPTSTNLGDSVTLTATVTPASGTATPTGTVEFYSNGNDLGPGTLSGGMATLTTTTLPAGSDAITADYQGDSTFSTSTSPATVVTVAGLGTTTTLTAAPTSTTVGDSVTFTAVVAPASGTGTPTGTVEFLNGPTEIGTGTLDDTGTATFSTTALPAGTTSITAEYLGDTTYATSTSPAVTVTVAGLPSTTTLTATPTSATFGGSVTLTAIVAPTSGTGTPTGSVEFYSGTTDLGPGTLSDGTATLTITTLPVGTDSVTADYGGDTTYATSTSPSVTVTVAQVDTTTTLTAAPTSTTVGSAVTLTATVTPVSGTGTPTGSVEFFSGTTVLGTEALSGTTATLTTSTLPVGTDSITATYSGDTNNLTSTSVATSVTVAQGTTTTTVSLSPTASVYGQPVTMTATVVVATGTGTPTGTVQFLNGTTVLGTATLNSSGDATFTTSALPTGTDSITAVYSGDANFSTSTSVAASFTVSQASTTATLTSSAASSALNGAVTFTAVVAPVSPGAGTPTGTVEFFNGSTALGSGTLDATGTATFTTTGLAVGSDSVTAQYEGDGNFSPSTSSSMIVTVGTSTQLFLNQVYLDVLYRPIDTAGLQLWEGRLANGWTDKQVVDAIVNSPEARFDAAENDFMTYLGYYVPANQLENALNAAKSTGKGLKAVILSSPAYLYALEAQGIVTLQSYLQDVTEAVTGSSLPQPAQGYLAGEVAHGTSLIDVDEQILLSPAGKDAILTNIFENILDRDPTDQELAQYGGALNAPIYNRAVTAALLSSDEFYTLATTPVTLQATSTALTVVPTSATAGDSVTLTAVVTETSGTGTPTGTVGFFNGTTEIGTATLDSTGTATLSTTALPAGTDSVTADYLGDDSNAASTSPATTVTIAQVATTTTLTAAPTATTVGSAVTLTATVTPASGSGTPTGTVEFLNGTTVIGTGTLSDGVATLTTNALPIGSNAITADYEGDTNDLTSTSAATNVLITQGTGTTTSTTLTAAPTATNLGQAVTLTAVVTPSSGTTTPTGTVVFFNGATEIGTGTLDDTGTATLSTTTLPAGSNSITAEYLGDDNFSSSTAPAATVTVTGLATTTTLSAVPTSTTYGDSVTLTATIAPASGTGTPTGSVVFYNGTTNLGTGTVTNGTATLSTAALPAGSDSITAEYLGDTTYAASTATASTVTVAQVATTTTLSASPTSTTSGSTVTLRAVVVPAGGTGSPTGTVEFLNNGTSIGTGTLSDEVATLTTATLPVGTNSITATYEGDTNNQTSTSTPVTVTIS